MLTKLLNHSPMPPTKINRWDMVAIGLTLLLSLCFFLMPVMLYDGQMGEYCRITWDEGEMTLSLDTPDTVTVTSGGITLTIGVSHEGVSVRDCTCPDRICQNTGSISRPGEMIVCVPADVVIRIPVQEAEEADYVLG